MRVLLLTILFSSSVYAATENFSTHIKVASDNKLGMNTRWNALIKAADFSEKKHLDSIKKFLFSKEWYMRNAAMLAIQKINPSQAAAEAKKLLNDKALVVRSAAVEIVARNLNDDHKKLLADELVKPYNFHNKKSLWIRKQIIEKLSSVAGSQDRDIFVKSLFDSDKEISRISAATLEKITGHQVDKDRYVDKWKALVKEKNWM